MIRRPFLNVPVLPRLVLVIVALSMLPAAADIFLKSVSLDPDDLSLNRLSIQSDPTDGSARLAYETSGLVLSDRIEFRLAPDHEFTLVSAPANWQMQSTLVSEGGQEVKVVSFFYGGADPDNTAEFTNLATPWEIAFRIIDLEPDGSGTDPITMQVPVSVSASTIIQGLGVLPVTESFPLSASLSTEETRKPLEVAIDRVEEAGAVLRFEELLPGIRYIIESSENLSTWSERAVLQPTHPELDWEETLNGGIKSREFFRVVIVPG